MSAEVSHRTDLDGAAPSRSMRLMVAGRQGAKTLGELLIQFYRASRHSVNSRLALDYQTGTCLFEIGVDEQLFRARVGSGVNTIIGLCNSSVGFETHLVPGGSFLLDSSTVTVYPRRDDIEIALIPANTLVEKALYPSSLIPDCIHYEDLSAAVMAGATLSYAGERVETSELSQAFQKDRTAQYASMILAAYQGYDWVQEHQLRGKSLRSAP